MKKSLKACNYLIGIILLCCCTPYPELPRDPVMFTGVPERGEMCRMVDTGYQSEDPMCGVVSPYIEGYNLYCIETDCDSFKGYKCLKHEDIAMIQQYITDLIKSCKSWK